jgi:hypothetical protein
MKERVLPFALASLFLALGSFALDVPGVQADESLFASVLFEPKTPPVTVRVIFTKFPAMCYAYIGTVKTAIYAVVWRFFEPSATTVHIPVLLVGALGIYIFARLLQRLRQPLWAAVLLATDATYLMTTRSDWGPVAMQHLFGIAGVYAGVRYAQTMQLKWVAAAGFLFGLGFWDKITFLFVLFGLAAGVLVTARHLIKPKPVAVLAAFFLIGCYPLLVYNYKTGGESFKGNSALDTGPIWRKADLLWLCLGDVNLFAAGWDHALPPVEPSHPVAATLSRLDFTFPLLPWLFAAGLLGAPWLWRSPVYRFALVAMIGGYGYMFLLRNAGSGAHHTVLLWPLPHLIAASLPLRRWIIPLVVCANLLQINHFYMQFLRKEVSVEWSDATAALAARLKGDPNPYYVLDWGIAESIYLLNRGQNDLRYGPVPGGRTISHVPKLTFFPNDTKFITEETITDSAGRPVFLISRQAPIEGK